MKSQGWDPCKTRPEMHTHREKGHVRTQQEPGKEVSPEINLTGTFIFDFQLTELWESKNSFLFKPPSLWYAVMVAQAE